MDGDTPDRDGTERVALGRTQSPASARRLRLALRASGAGLGEVDLATGALDLDERFRDVFDLGTRGEVVAEDLFARLIPADAERMRRRMAEIRAGDDPDMFSGEVVASDGPRFFDLVVEVSERDPDGRPRRLVGLVRDVTARVARLREVEAERLRAETLIEELHHRVRNNFALMRSVISLSAADSGTVEEMKTDTLRRLHAMAAAHTLSQGGTERISAGDLAEAVLSPFQGERGGVRLRREGDPALPGTKADVLAMVLHALATQSARRGALASGAEAEVTIREDALHWRDERGCCPEGVDLLSALRGSRVLAAGASQLGGEQIVTASPDAAADLGEQDGPAIRVEVTIPLRCEDGSSA